MSKVSTPGFCLLLLTITAGCGTSKKDGPQPSSKQSSLQSASSEQSKSSRVQSLLDDYVSALKSSSDKLGQVVDKASALSAAEELKKSAKRFSEIAKELKSVGKLTKAENSELSTKGLQTASANYSKANKGLTAKLQEGALPPEATKALQEALLDFGKASMEFSEATKAIAP